MQAEWEEMARRNWISENQEAPGQVTISTIEKVTQSFLIQYILPVKIWDEPQLFKGTQENSLSMEANFTPKSSSSLSACKQGRFKRPYHSEKTSRLAHTAWIQLEGSQSKLLDYGHFWRWALKEEHQIKKSGLAHSNTVEDRNDRDSVSFIPSIVCFNLIYIM